MTDTSFSKERALFARIFIFLTAPITVLQSPLQAASSLRTSSWHRLRMMQCPEDRCHRSQMMECSSADVQASPSPNQTPAVARTCGLVRHRL
jgi:hypothetical protein